jgi:hypothetical protein
MKRLAGAVILALCLAVRAAEPSPADVEDPQVGHDLEAIRDQLVALDIEGALARLEGFVRRPGLSDARLIEAYDLRAQAHATSGDLKAVETDYKEILKLSAGYTPRSEVTSKKAMDRFVKLKAAMVGTVRLDVTPKDAAITVDDRAVAAAPDGSFAALAGERRLRLTRKGFDSVETTVRAVAGTETLLQMKMVPNARGLVARTDVDGVAVSVDGVPVGVTSRTGEGGASLTIDEVAIGEHQIDFTKPCFATESLQEIVSVDIEDRTPKTLRVVAMRPDRTAVLVTGADYPGELRIDGESAGALPLTSLSVCPGSRAIEVVAAGRVVWSGTFTAEGQEPAIDLTPRPNAVLVGAAWPASWAPAVAGWSVRGKIDLPAGVDLTVPSGWTKVSLPPGTDLAVAVLPDGGLVGDERAVLFGPSLLELDDHAKAPQPGRPSWRQATVAAGLVDAGPASVLIAWATPGGPAAKAGLIPGDRVVSLSGQAPKSASSARETVAKTPVGTVLALEIESPLGGSRKVDCPTVAEPALLARSGDRSERILRSAWAAADAAAGGPDATLALASLATLLESAGRNEAALEAWRRVQGGDDPPLSARASYAIGAGLQSAGKNAEAIEAFERARSEAERGADAVLASAAADRLADLGVAPR